MTGVILAALIAVSSTNPVPVASPQKADAFLCYEQYLAGVLYLSSTTTFKPDEKTAWYKSLEKLTGVTASDFVKFRHKYDYDPTGWEHVLKEAQNLPVGH